MNEKFRVGVSQEVMTADGGTIFGDDAMKILQKYKIEKLLIVDKDFTLRGLITIKDIEKSERFPHASKDPLGRLVCAAAVGVGKDRQSWQDRARLIDCGAQGLRQYRKIQ